MAIVGTAYVRLRVIGDKLKNDIAKSTRKAVDEAGPDLDRAGETVGEHVTEGAGRETERGMRSEMGRIGDVIGDELGRAMGDALNRSLRKRLGEVFRRSLGRHRPTISKLGNDLGDSFKTFKTRLEKNTKKINLKSLLMAGIAGLITALPSLLAGAANIVVAMAGQAVIAISAIGPAAAGAGVAAVAAFSAIKISAKLVGLAMKYPSAALEDFKKRAETFKGTIAKPIQVGLLSGFNAAMRISGPLIAAIQPQLTQLGTAVGDVAIGFANALRQAEMMSRIQTILANNNVFIGQAGAGVSQLGQAFIVLLSHLGPVLDYLGSGLQALGQWALTAITAAEASGSLDAWIQRMFSSLTYFVGILVDFGVGIWNVFKAAHAASGGMLANLHDTAASFRAWTGDAENQNKMTAWFQRARDLAGQVLDVIGRLGGAMARAAGGADFGSTGKGLSTLAGYGRPIAEMFRQIQQSAGPQLQKALENFADVFVQLAQSGVIGLLARAFADLFAFISEILAIPGVGQLLSFIAGLAVMMKTVGLLKAVIMPLVAVFTDLLIPAITALAAAVGWPIVIIGALVAALVWFFTQTEIGRKIIEVVWNAIKAAISWAIDAIVAAFDWLVSAFQAAWAWIANIAQGIWSAISTAFNAVVTAIRTAIQAVWTVITTVWNAIWGFIQPILQGIWDVISMVFNGIVTVIQWCLNLIWQIWIRIWPILALPIRILYGVILLIFQAIWAVISTIVQAVWDFLVMAWNAIVGAITAAVNFIWGVISSVWNAIWGFLKPIILTIWKYISTAWDNIVGAVSGALSAIWGFITGVWNAVWGFISGILRTIGGAVAGAWQGMTSAIGGALDAAWGVIKGVWDKITGFVSGALDFLKGLVQGAWDVMGDIGSGIVSGLKAAVNTMIDGVNWVIGGLNGAIHLANKLPGMDIPDIPKIPRLARGGIVSPTQGGTLALIGEAGRRERVEPLDPYGLSSRDRALIDQLAGGGGDTHVTVKIGETELRGIVSTEVVKKNNETGALLLTGRRR